MAKKRLNHHREAIVQALRTADPKLFPLQIDAELELLLVPNLWKRWMRQNERLDDNQRSLLKHHSHRLNSLRIIYKGPNTAALNLERAILDAGAKTASSPARELFYYYVGFGKVDTKGKETFKLGIKAKYRKSKQQARGVPYLWNKPKNILSDYDIEDSEESSSSDSDSDEAETDENEDSDGSDNSEDDLPTVVDPATGEGLFRTKQTDKEPKMSEPRQAHKEPVLQSEEYGIKRRRPTTKYHKMGPSRKRTKPKHEDFDETSNETDEDVEHDDKDFVDDDADDEMFGGMGRGDFTQYRGKEDFAFCMGWE